MWCWHRVSTGVTVSIIMLGVVASAARASAQEALPPLKFNVPYRCNDGTTITVLRCQSNPRAEVCFWRVEENGQLVGERYNVRSQMTGMMNECHLEAPAPARAAAPVRPPGPLPPVRPQEGAARPSSAAPGATAVQQPIRNDPGTLAARRCVELGGNELECMGKGLVTGLVDMSGVNPVLLNPPGPTGLRMTGSYRASTGAGLSFFERAVTLNRCGTLVDDSHNYTVGQTGSRILVHVDNEPQPFDVSIGPDGGIAGPGPTAVTGNVVVGHQNYWVTTRLEDGSVTGGHWEQQPIYEQRTQRCVIGALRPAEPTAFASIDETPLSPILGALSGASRTDMVPPGPRVAGRYAGASGLQVEFHEGAAVLDCGEAHVARPYSVENRSGSVLVTVQNGAAPFTLVFQPDGSLSGSGVVEVTGRVVAGMRGDAVNYAPRTARCAVGILTAR